MHLNVHVVGPESTLFNPVHSRDYSLMYNTLNQCVADGGAKLNQSEKRDVHCVCELRESKFIYNKIYYL